MWQFFAKHLAAVSLESESRSLVVSAVAVRGDKVSFDLSTSMGISGELDHPLLLDAIKQIIKLTQTHDIALGCYVNDFESGEQWLNLGVQLIACGNDAFLLTRKFAEEHQKFKNAAALK